MTCRCRMMSLILGAYSRWFDDRIAESFLLIVPVQAGAQLVRRVLHEAGEHVLAGRRDEGSVSEG